MKIYALKWHVEAIFLIVTANAYVTGFAKRYLFHTQNLTHFLTFETS